jgi:AcrR family transcriptional regulator
MAKSSPRVASRPRRAAPRPQNLRREDSRDLRDAILVATERLLADRPLDEITVADVVDGAGVSRATFYIYFESKNAAVAALAEDVTGKIYQDLWEPFLSGAEQPSESLLTAHFLDSLALWREHRDVLAAAAGAWRADPNAFYQWGALWSRYAADLRSFIERECAAGEAPGDLDAGTLAATLVWFDETAFYLAVTDGAPELADDDRLARTIAGVWMRAIYGPAPPE